MLGSPNAISKAMFNFTQPTKKSQSDSRKYSINTYFNVPYLLPALHHLKSLKSSILFTTAHRPSGEYTQRFAVPPKGRTVKSSRT